MSEIFLPVNGAQRVNERYESSVDPVPKVEVYRDEIVRVYEGKEITDVVEVTVYEKDGNLKSVISTAQIIDFLI